MAQHRALSQLYRGARQRLSELVLAHPEADGEPVPATPGWSIHDVVAHVTGVAEDLAGGWRPTGGPTDEWTAGHVARGRGVPTTGLLEKWAAVSPAIEDLVDGKQLWAPVIDAGSHEHDVRGALGDREARDSELVITAAAFLLEGMKVPEPLVVRTERLRTSLGPETGQQEPTTLTTTTFEAFRWRMGRRSLGQLAAMDWSGDPAPYLDHLCVFGPAGADVVE